MSQNIDHNNISQHLGRGRRDKRRSQKAQEALESEGHVISGASPEPGSSPATLSMPSITKAPPIEGRSGMPPVSRTPGLLIGPSSSEERAAQDYRLDLDNFAPDKFVIYLWPAPRPKDFLDLAPYHRTWKARTDRRQKGEAIDDGQDDWDAFDNGLDNRVIASCFMKRAKRAFWAGKCWEEFEKAERSISSVTLDAQGEEDQFSLDNGRRMAIFEVIKIRLCEEIWLEEYVPEESQAIVPNKGLERIDTPEPLQPTKEERAAGIVRLSRNREGVPEPWYEGEPINPSGLNNMMRSFRNDGASLQTSVSGHKAFRNRQSGYLHDTAVPQIGNVGIGGPVGLSAVEEIAARPLNMEDSD